ncbi:MAG: sulfotransferase domain-containing protein [Cytophagales bacterium]|nr:sulfotransferase domain-containing protein [Cytophagales bacterium]
MLPNFFIVGAPKAATTFLYHHLNQHPEIYMSREKEPNYFSFEEISEQNLFHYYNKKGFKTLEEYEILFNNVKNEKAIGEASVSYLFYPKVPQKIHQLVSNAKIIIILRDPIDRGFSHYLMDYRLGLVHLTFEEIVFQRVRHEKLPIYHQQYIELGFYYEQVKRYLDTFGLENVKVFFQEDLKKDTEKVLTSLFTFLGVNPNFRSNFEEKQNVFEIPKNDIIQYFYNIRKLRKALKSIMPKFLISQAKVLLFHKGKKAQLNNATKTYLKFFYREDINKLAKLLNRNLKNWCH